MEINIVTICFLLMIFISEAFFINNKDIKRVLRIFNPAAPVAHHRLPPYYPHYRRNEDFETNSYYDRSDRFSPKGNLESDRYPKQNVREDKINNRPFTRYHNTKNHDHHNCEHDHSYYNRRQHKVPEDLYENPPKNKKFEKDEEDEDYYDSANKHNKKFQKKKNQNPPKNKKYEDDDEESEDYYDSSLKKKKYNNHKKGANEDSDEKNGEDKPLDKPINYKKDYVTGVLVTIPKIHDDDVLRHHYHHARDARPQNLFFHNILRTDENDQHSHHHHQHHLNDGEIIKSIIY